MTLMTPAISEISSMINLSEYLPEITIDFFSGIGGWQRGSNQEFVVSIEKDPVVAKVHSAQTGMTIIDCNQVKEIARLRLEDLPIILNFNVTDKRWWILFMIFKVNFARASPSCISWSGASYAAGLDHDDGLLLLETLSICDSVSIQKIALENVAAILSHKHWKCIKQFIEDHLGKFLHILKIDLQYFMPMRRLRAFIFICDDEHLPVLELPKTRDKRHYLQAGAWTPLFRATSKDLQVNDLAYKAATDPKLLPWEWKNG